MSFRKSVALLVLILFTNVVKSIRLEFMFDNDQIFDPCPEGPNPNGIHDMVDFTEFSLEYTGSEIRASGNITCVWQDVQPTDRIEVRIEIYKFRRGIWQLTPYTIYERNFCFSQFDFKSYWYQMWTKYIPATERKCLNNFGHVYHHQPFTVDVSIEVFGDAEGRHKIVEYFAAFDRNNQKRQNHICFQFEGEFFKVN